MFTNQISGGVQMRFPTILVATMTLAGCLPAENALQQQASNSACARSETSWGTTTLEMPPENLGGDLVGMYTLSSGEQGPAEYGRYSVVDCQSGAITRVEVHADVGQPGRDIRQWIERLRANGAMSSPGTLARAAEQVEGLSAFRGTVRRQDTGRAACACIKYYPEAWASGFPPDSSGLPKVYVEPTGLPVAHSEIKARR